MSRSINKILLLVLFFICLGCTQNQRARYAGGTRTIELPENTKLVNATWKDEHLWYLIRWRKEGEPTEIYTFQEDSSFGIFEGKIIGISDLGQLKIESAAGVELFGLKEIQFLPKG